MRVSTSRRTLQILLAAVLAPAGITVVQHRACGAGRYPAGTSANQQWSVPTDATNVRLRNRATGLYLDGMGRTSNGAPAGPYSDSTGADQRWKIVAAG